MSGSDFLEGVLVFVVYHIPLAVVCLQVYEHQQRIAPGSRIQYSLIDLFLLTIAAALTISIWSLFVGDFDKAENARSLIILAFLLTHQLAGVLIMRLQPRMNWNNNTLLQSFWDIVIGSVIGTMVMTQVSVIGAMTLVFWLPIWLIYRLRKRSQRRAAALLEPGNAEKHP